MAVLRVWGEQEESSESARRQAGNARVTLHRALRAVIHLNVDDQLTFFAGGVYGSASTPASGQKGYSLFSAGRDFLHDCVGSWGFLLNPWLNNGQSGGLCNCNYPAAIATGAVAKVGERGVSNLGRIGACARRRCGGRGSAKNLGSRILQKTLSFFGGGDSAVSEQLEQQKQQQPLVQPRTMLGARTRSRASGEDHDPGDEEEDPVAGMRMRRSGVALPPDEDVERGTADQSIPAGLFRPEEPEGQLLPAGEDPVSAAAQLAFHHLLPRSTQLALSPGEGNAALLINTSPGRLGAGEDVLEGRLRIRPPHHFSLTEEQIYEQKYRYEVDEEGWMEMGAVPAAAPPLGGRVWYRYDYNC